ncbi:hypothetical protein PMZ80_002516 [Knufia obscura]|uniref:Uncharacterized protein n=2 Tax=Knufia TaxID=430999 RepID=A0AAN8EJ61_9EURO|nr:hypothetical protein PMZ80_002516 [Knufia obscura]KAK5950775.1 hypothetical protein OHC33_008158 [Knufia fluminis]
MASPPTMQELQEDIDLYEGLYNSCAGVAGMEDDQEEYKKKLAELRARVDRMGQVWSTQNGRPSTQQSNQSTSPSTATSSVYDNPTASASKQYLTLPSRKRDRGEFDDDMDTESLHKIKSRRSTPAHSPAVSAVDSVGSDYFDNPELGNLLGDSWQDEVRSNREYLKQQEAKRRQQQEDERMARRLQEEFNTTQSHSTTPAFGRTPSTQASTQATFRPNGSFAKPTPPQALHQEPREPQEHPWVKNEIKDERAASPATISSSDDDFSFVSPSEWSRRFPSSSGPSRNLPQSFNQYGSYGSTQSAYTSMPGSSVYGGAPQQAGQSGALVNGLPSLGSLPGLTSLGTFGDPFDLETLRSIPSALQRGMNGLYGVQEAVDPQETQEEIRQLLHNIRPDEEIDPSEAGENQPEGLKAKLMPHQVKGLAWMKKMEDGTNKGGILADDMGLGKTIQSIALMLSRPPAESSKKPTLVVCPVALMDQWRREVLKLVRGSSALTILLLHGPNSHLPWARVKHYDLVLTSYGTLSSELRRKVNWEEKLKLNPDAKKTKKDEFPVLDDKAFFHRIFLDEAQNIKNKSTKTAMAACRVNAEFRWCLSGTPMQNSVEEMYSLIKWCRIRPYNDWDKFSKDIARPLKARYEVGQKRAMEKLQALLKAILLRRTKKSQIDGKPILQLPEKRTVETRAIFNRDQLAFYQALETSSQIQFNKFVKNGTVGRNYSKALVLLLRLRQCCCSPQLVINSADFITDSGVEGIDLVANAKELPEDAVARIKELEDIECPICFDAVENPIIFNPCGHALCHDCFSRMVDDVREENADNVKCPHCRARIDTKKITDFASFNDVYGDGPRKSEADPGEDAGQSTAEEEEEDSSDDDDVESDGSDDGEDLKDFIVNDDASIEADSEFEDEDDLDQIKKPKKSKMPAQSSKLKFKTSGKVHKGKSKKKKSKGKKKKEEHKSLADLRKEGLKSRAAKKKYLRQLGKIYEPCAKIDKTLELLNDIQNEGRGEKTIIFSSFTSFLDLVEVPLSEDQNLSNYTRYDGSMTPKDRNEAVLRFTDDPDCRVMLVSLKAGNAGLNLTIANHVIILDPFWNPFVEHQAADRCHRIGQKREVTVHRVLIGEEGVDHAAEPERVFTVEDRILALQEKKRKLVESALDENAASSVSRLGVRELGYLFGVGEMPRQNAQ